MQVEKHSNAKCLQVRDQGSGQIFSGASPTRPWTDVCLAHRTGQRISGPLFFGFSSPITQAAIAMLYTPRELAAAQAVSKMTLVPPEYPAWP